MPRSSRPSPPKRRKVVTTVNLDPEVIEYLRELQQVFDRDRSYLVNAMVQEFRNRRGVPVTLTSPTEAFTKQLSA